MAVPAARICASPGVVLHKPGGHVKPPSPPLCRGGSPPSAAYLRRTGVADAPTYPDLYYIPPDVAAAKQLPPGWYATLSAGDEFEVVVAAPAAGAAARTHLSRALPAPYTHLAVVLAADGVEVDNWVFDNADVVFRGWCSHDPDTGVCEYQRFRMDRTVGTAAVAGAAADAADACPDVGRLSLTWRPLWWLDGPVREFRSAPAAPPPLTERDAVKSRSLVAGAGTSVTVTKSIRRAKWGPVFPDETVTIYYRERRVLVAKGILVDGGAVAPAYRGPAAGGGSGAAAKPRAASLQGEPPRLGAGGSPGGTAKAERLGGGAAPATPAAATGGSTPPLATVKAEGVAGGDPRHVTGAGGRKRKAAEVVVLD